jgi:hypothetical protein
MNQQHDIDTQHDRHEPHAVGYPFGRAFERSEGVAKTMRLARNRSSTNGDQHDDQRAESTRCTAPQRRLAAAATELDLAGVEG